MSEITLGRASPLSWLRRPRFSSEDKRTPAQSVLHALPAFLFLALNVWIAGMGMVVFIAAFFTPPIWFSAALAAVLSIPCLLLSWGLFVRCVEVEAAMND